MSIFKRVIKNEAVLAIMEVIQKDYEKRNDTLLERKRVVYATEGIIVESRHMVGEVGNKFTYILYWKDIKQILRSGLNSVTLN